ncbi:unnamed protein product [Lepeophtheirus salmonis]|uniref:(salmon louse) hypothetical protein n=1 Tax=Lepeophtheirus salmonis TaxID=72036 RepID=A0A7R8D353_LEPSM|nr:unnamed protein product [Lepeophtheirus salmonis]CAF3007640.1 unnamed protein product [Lepeophtheirus salmonis]
MGKKQNAIKVLRTLEDTGFLGRKAVEDLRSICDELEVMSMEDVKDPSKIAVVEQEVVHVEKKVNELREVMGEYAQVEELSYQELTESTYHKNYSKLEEDLITQRRRFVELRYEFENAARISVQ